MWDWMVDMSGLLVGAWISLLFPGWCVPEILFRSVSESRNLSSAEKYKVCDRRCSPACSFKGLEGWVMKESAITGELRWDSGADRGVDGGRKGVSKSIFPSEIRFPPSWEVSQNCEVSEKGGPGGRRGLEPPFRPSEAAASAGGSP